MFYGDYINGYVERKGNGSYEGSITIDGISIPSITATYFEKDGKTHLWLRRKDIMEYNYKTLSYITRPPRPQWEAYLTKQIDEESSVAYKGEFVFLRFKYSIVGLWDAILGKERERLNLFVERLPQNEQTILLKINENNRRNGNRS